MLPLEPGCLLLRPFTLEDLDDAHAVLDGHPDVWHFDPGFARTREQRGAELHYRILQYEREGFGMLAVCTEPGAVLIGYCGLQTYVLPAEPYATPEAEVI